MFLIFHPSLASSSAFKHLKITSIDQEVNPRRNQCHHWSSLSLKLENSNPFGTNPRIFLSENPNQ